MSLRALSLIMCRKVIRESMKHYISIDLKSKGGEILKIKFVKYKLGHTVYEQGHCGDCIK